MYVDDPGTICRKLPQLVPDDTQVWARAQPDSFVRNLAQAMQVRNLVCDWPEIDAAHRLPTFWHDILLIAEAPRSQYDALREVVARGGPMSGHIACVALQGHNFHGQHGRSWAVLPGNLHLSAALTCDLPAPEFAPVMPALPAVAVTEAVAELGTGRLVSGIKWVNDVLLNGRKVAGSLTALRTFRGRITTVVVGIGLNVEQAPDLPADLASSAATSLRAEQPGAVVALEPVLRLVLEKLAVQFARLNTDGPAGLLADYRRLSLVLGRQVGIRPDTEDSEGPLLTGEVLSIGPDLSLKLRGQSAPVTAGRLTLLPPGT